MLFIKFHYIVGRTIEDATKPPQCNYGNIAVVFEGIQRAVIDP